MITFQDVKNKKLCDFAKSIIKKIIDAIKQSEVGKEETKQFIIQKM